MARLRRPCTLVQVQPAPITGNRCAHLRTDATASHVRRVARIETMREGDCAGLEA